MIPMMNGAVFSRFPDWLSAFTHSGIVLSAVTALVLNLFLNGMPELEAETETALSGDEALP